MEGPCTKRKPTVQLVKDQLTSNEAAGSEGHAADGDDMREADAETLRSRRRVKIVRSHPSSVTTDTAKDSDNSKTSNTQSANFTNANCQGHGKESCVMEGHADFTCPIEYTSTDSDRTETTNTLTENTISGELKGAAAFVSPFSCLGGSGGSFFLTSTATTGGAFCGAPSAGSTEELEECDVPPPEELTVVATAVDDKEEVIFSDRECRMQFFDISTKSWCPKPPLDGKVDLVVPKDPADSAHSARILFFVNRTGRLRLNTPILPSNIKFRNPPEKVGRTTTSDARAATDGTSDEKNTDKETSTALPLKLNTVEFTGLKTDAADAKDTTFYRIRFSSIVQAEEFMSLANTRQEQENASSE